MQMPCEGPFSKDTDGNYTAAQVCTDQFATNATFICLCTAHGDTSTGIDWAQNKRLYIYDAEATTACQTCDSCQKLT